MAHIGVSYVTKNNLEEAIMFLIILIRKFSFGKINLEFQSNYKNGSCCNDRALYLHHVVSHWIRK